MTEEIVNYLQTNPAKTNKKRHLQEICKVVKITTADSEIIAEELQAPVDNYVMMEIEAELVSPMPKMTKMSSGLMEESNSLKRCGGDHEMLENSDLPSTSHTNNPSIGSLAEELCARESGIATNQAQSSVQEFEVKQSSTRCSMEDIMPSSDLIEKQEYTEVPCKKIDGSISQVDVSSADLMDGEIGLTNGGPESNLRVASHDNNFTSLRDPCLIQIPEKIANFEIEAEQVFDGPPVNTINAPEDSLVEDKHEEKDTSLGVDVTEHVSSLIVHRKDNLMEIDHSPPKLIPIVSRRKKLLIIDINGLLADIVCPPPPREYRADVYIARRAIFKRPFYKEFLHFCLERFDVAIWSSRTEKNVERVTNYLLGEMKQKMLFCWDVSQCTPTGVKTLENKHKDLVCKELKRIWEKDDPILPWAKGDYDESNTLLLDDSPYKALLNPPHSAIFPPSFKFHHRHDTSLGSGGDIRVYLEELYAAENVQKYVEKHPFGQSAINESDSSWEFYNKILSAPQLPLILDPSVQPTNEVNQIEGKTMVESKNQVKQNGEETIAESTSQIRQNERDTIIKPKNQVNENGGQSDVQTMNQVILNRGVDREHIIVIYDPSWYI